VLPGLPLSLGLASTWLGLIVVVPLAGLLVAGLRVPTAQLVQALVDGRARAALVLSFGAAGLAALINVVFGTLLAWVLVRYRFPGRRLADALVDLPFALPTAVAGIALTALYGPHGWLGGPLEALGLKVAYTRLGIVVALVFVGLPFVVRTVQPVLADLDPELEEAAASLGAGRLRVVTAVIAPEVAPAVLTGFTLAFARSLGEYGSVIFIAGNLPGRTEIVPLLIVIRLESYDYAGAAALGLLMLAVSLLLLGALNAVQRWSQRRAQPVEAGRGA
jgi:sulfate transport system permease protein